MLFVNCFYASPGQQAEHNVFNLSIRSWVTKLVNTVVWQRMNRFWCQVVHAATAWNDQLWESGGQRLRSRETGDSSGGLAEASFLTSWVEVSCFLWLSRFEWRNLWKWKHFSTV